MRNAEIAAALDELADLYELDGAVVYRVVAYRQAAKAVRDSSRSVAQLAQEQRATEVAGIGKTLEEKIQALVDTGDIPAAVKLRAKFPGDLIRFIEIPGLGPKTARKIYDELGITTLDELRAAAETGTLKSVRGLGPKAQENIVKALEADGRPERAGRLLLSAVLGIGEQMVAALREHPAADRVELAGSARRMTDTCKDLDIIVASTEPAAIADAFAQLQEVEAVQSPGDAGARAVTHSGLAVDLRVVPPENFGNLLQHLTGSGRHNEALRTEAVRRGLHVSEYGIADDESDETHACADEQEVYGLLGMQWIPPELREDRGELQAARENGLPELVTVDDIRGDLHCHTTASDGRNSIVEMGEAARERGYDYLAITDHSASHGFGNDVQPDELRRQ